MYTVVGKKHLSGKSKKTGNNFDFYLLCLVYDVDNDQNLVGQAVKESVCSEDIYETVSVGTTFDKVFYDERGSITFIEN